MRARCAGRSRWVLLRRRYEQTGSRGVMSAGNVALAAGGQVDDVRAEERYRLRLRLDRLCTEQGDVALVLRSWLALRAERIEYEASDALAVSADERLTLSGVSDNDSGVTRSNETEAYVRAGDLANVERGNALFRVGRGEGNVVLHAVGDSDAGWLRTSALLTAADLAERVDVRSRTQATVLVRQWCESRER